jgi:hypothetical protein
MGKRGEHTRPARDLATSWALARQLSPDIAMCPNRQHPTPVHNP